jgi:DNA polymerase III subunit chi
MTDIAFHFNVPDKLGYSCRLLRKAYLSGAKLVVTGAPDMLVELDQLLWTFSASEFVPHYRVMAAKPDTAQSKLLAATPVLLVESLRQCGHQGVLVNLGSGIPDEFERFERFIEVVTMSDSDRLAARHRWKHYADRGYVLKRHDLTATGDNA